MRTSILEGSLFAFDEVMNSLLKGIMNPWGFEEESGSWFWKLNFESSTSNYNFCCIKSTSHFFVSAVEPEFLIMHILISWIFKFVSSSFHISAISIGFLLGTRQTLLETKDGGKSWTPRSIPSAEDEDFNYRFNSISFYGKEGWIVGKPAILLHTSDAGTSWERIPLSSRLPGTPVSVVVSPEEGFMIALILFNTSVLHC